MTDLNSPPHFITAYEGFPYQFGKEIVFSVRRLENMVKDTNYNFHELNKIFKRIEGIVNFQHPVTEDGYIWFSGHEANLRGGRVAILFPWKQRPSMFRNKNDRRIGVYGSSAELDIGEVNRILIEMSNTMRRSVPEQICEGEAYEVPPKVYKEL